MAAAATLRHFLSQLRVGERLARPPNEEWKAMIERISVPGRIAEIHKRAYFYFLEVLPPKFQGAGFFAFAEGAEELRIFWKRNGQFFCRLLNWEQTKEFCSLTHVSFPYWF